MPVASARRPAVSAPARVPTQNRGRNRRRHHSARAAPPFRWRPSSRGGATPTIRRYDETAHVRVVQRPARGGTHAAHARGQIEVAGLEVARYTDDAKGVAPRNSSSAGDVAENGGQLAKRTGAARSPAASLDASCRSIEGVQHRRLPDSWSDAMHRCDVVVAQHEVSRHHARDRIGDEGIYIAPAGLRECEQFNT
jgi:hypothetical protein